ncbi:DNA repair protein RadA [candidate division KSB1 bacterium 4572_119]|nr:MAG: DNA repair protein RadA [candidate division KSB1 bacterium 4572_119]
MVKPKKEKLQYVCQSCGYVSHKWLGRCTECGEWNSIVEEKVVPQTGTRSLVEKSSVSPVPLNQIQFQNEKRIDCHSPEFNRVLGGGIVSGSLVLIGGDPGIGKSTLMLQEAARLSGNSANVLYVSGEESLSQTKMRAERLGLDSEKLFILAENNLENVINELDKVNARLLVIDSIQTIYSPQLESSPGSISQVRECAHQFLQLAKTRNLPVFLIGHVTKEGYIAGPKVLEHTVDTLLQFEGDRNHFFRILRAVKNRFGSTNEIGVFEMTEKGLADVSNPSEIFLSQRKTDLPGSVVISIMEGTRPLLLEVQALVSPTNYGLPQRSATGIDPKRLSMLLAVLEKRVGMKIGTFDVFVNAVGGVRIDETAADLGIALAIVSSLRNQVITPNAVLVGEIGLTGEIRPVAHIERRIAEAEKLGLKGIVIPEGNYKSLKKKSNIKIQPVAKLSDAVNIFVN